jgi:hypothetical protein
MGEHIFFEEELFMTKGKKFFLGMAVLLMGASLFVIGCSTEADPEYLPSEMIHVDEVAGTLPVLRDHLKDDGEVRVVGVTGNIALATTGLTVPKEKTVYILSGFTLDVSTLDLTVNGIVYAGNGGTLKAESTGAVKIPADSSGHVYVTKGGNLSVAGENNVTDGTNSVLATKVGFANESKLTLLSIAAADLSDFFTTYVTNGTLVVTTLTSPALKPSDVTAIPGISSTKGLDLSSTALTTAEDQATLNIPATVAINAGSLTLDTVTNLTVNGGLSAPLATLHTSSPVTVSGSGYLEVGNVADAIALDIIEGDFYNASVGTTGAITANSGLTIDEGKTRTLTGAGVAPSGTVTVDGTLTIASAAAAPAAPVGNITVNGKLVIASASGLKVAATLAVNGTLAFADNTSKVTILGSITAASTGVFSAKSTLTDGSAVKLTVENSSALGTAVGFTSNNATPPTAVTLLQGTANTNGGATAYIIGNASFLVNNVANTYHSADPVASTADTPVAGTITAGASSAVVLVGST